MWSKWLLGTLCAVPFTGTVMPHATAKDWYVASHADANGDGSRTHPFASLTTARDSIRLWLAEHKTTEATNVWLLDGEYKLDDTFVLREQDSGTKEFPVTWQAAPGCKVQITGELESLLAIYDTSHLHLHQIEFRGAKHLAVELAHCHDVTLNDCVISTIHDTGVHLFGGDHCQLNSVWFENIDRHAVRIEAGNRLTLDRADHKIRDCHITQIGFAAPEDSAAIYVAGVGSQVIENRISQCAGAAIQLDGNDHLVESNEIVRVCLSQHDMGAIYLGHDWTERGNQIVKNIIRDLGGAERSDVIAIYLDDFASGNRVHGNVISSAGRGIAIGGGEANDVQNNVIEDCLVGIQLDQRGDTWLAHVIHDADSYLNVAWRELQPARELYQARYPELRNQAQPSGLAQGNQIVGNLLQRCGAVAVAPQVALESQSIAKNQIGERLFVLHWGADPQLTLVREMKVQVHPIFSVAVEPRSPSDQSPVKVIRPENSAQRLAQTP